MLLPTLLIFYIPGFARSQTTANAGTQRSNLYFDELLAVVLKQEASGLDARPLPTFAFAFGRGNRHVANFTRIRVTGLAGGLQRVGDASAPGFLRGNLTVGANVRLANVTVDCGGHVKLEKAQFSQLVDLRFLLKNTVALVEVMAYPPEHPHLLTFQLLHGGANMTAVIPQVPVLETDEMKHLVEGVHSAIKLSTEAFLNGPFRSALERAVVRKPMPKP
ncbi:uncharacterized protein LOC144139472 [Haemaphysalis longicornis]